MDDHVNEFFSSGSAHRDKFYKVIPLHGGVDMDWSSVSKLVPQMCKGWFELSRLPVKTRIQFTFEFWLSKMPYHPNSDTAFSAFFDALDDIGIFLTQKASGEPFDAQMVYSLSKNRGFYQGSINASEHDILYLQKLYPDFILPKDYLSFLQIHNGFCKATDCSGIIGTKQAELKRAAFREWIQAQELLVTKSGKIVDPTTLIPFYESFGMPFYQCFWAEWHPIDEMGNVYYSGADNTISDRLDENGRSCDQMAFPSFSHWLIFYLEQIDV